MFMRLLLVATICVGLMATVGAEPVAAETKEVVKYQLLEWKNKHTKNNEDAEKLIKTFKMLKVETEVSDHGNHKDVKYRCPKWKQLTVKDHDTAHQWEAWLKKLGFKTIHEH
ncbi:hypothetical protein EC9_53250 [Rosistilla ulvae]|uniref:Uncharacterized protein n=1 Tax=Rosistilla ulvae TaxID=1930277 RepID=A0A517M890_9BACT|nr:hypothetical protein [Rosistilla ulvae]QDS91105.1 hypothetical protein EC9_53250 [Rosistilla ulvae]